MLIRMNVIYDFNNANRIADTEDLIWFYTRVSLLRLAKDLSLPNTYHIIG